MRAVKILGKFFAFLLTVLFGILFTLFIAVLFVRNIISYEVIDSSVKDFDIFSVSGKEVSYGENKTIREQISEELLGMDVSLNVVNGFFDSEEIHDMVSDYSYNYVTYVLFGGTKPTISENKIVELFRRQFDLYGYDFDEKRIEIETYVSLTCDKLNKSVPDTNDIDNMGYDTSVITNVADIIFSDMIFIGLIVGFILIYILISICLWSNARALKYITIPVFLEGIIILTFNLAEVKIMERFVNSQGIIDSLILSIFYNGFNKFFELGICLIIVGVVLFVISILLLKRANKKSKELLDNVIEEELVKSGAKYDLREHIAVTDEDMDKIDNTMTSLKIKEELEKEKIEKENLKVEIDDNFDGKVQFNEKVIVTENGEIDKIEITSNIEKQEIPEVEPYIIEKEIEPSETVSDVILSNEYDKVDSSLNIEKEQLSESEVRVPLEEVKEFNESLPVVTNGVREIEVVEEHESLPIISESSNMEFVEVPTEDINLEKIYEDVENPDELVIEEVSLENEEDIDDEVSTDEFVEMDEILEDIVINKDLDISVPNSVKVEIVSPKKGNDIQVDLSASEELEEEEIEFL